jgi:hypothetical protein
VHTEAGITVTKDLSIAGQGADTTVVQAAATLDTAHDRVFTIARGVTVTIQGLTIRHGSARAAKGGGLLNEGTLTLTNSTITGKSAGHGGGLYNYLYTGHGAFYEGDVRLINSSVANNPYGGDCHGGSITFHDYSLDSDGRRHLTAPADRPGVDPRLGPLQDNGGPTLTHALLPGSPALDAIPFGTHGCGTTLISDQRWQARPEAAGGACDIGAYEVAMAGQSLSGWVTGLTPETVVCQNVTTGQVVTLNDPATSWDCETAGLAVTPGARAAWPAAPGTW